MTRKAAPQRRSGRLAAARKLNQGLRHELRNFPAATVAQYVRVVGATLGQADVIRGLSDLSLWRANMGRLEEANARLAAELEKFTMSAPLPARIEALENPASYNSADDESFYRAVLDSRAAADALREQITRSLQRTQSRRRGRREADADGVLAYLARRYLELFGERPRSTPGGTFSNIAALALENLHGTAPRDVSRQVRAAIKTL